MSRRTTSGITRRLSQTSIGRCMNNSSLRNGPSRLYTKWVLIEARLGLLWCICKKYCFARPVVLFTVTGPPCIMHTDRSHPRQPRCRLKKLHRAQHRYSCPKPKQLVRHSCGLDAESTAFVDFFDLYVVLRLMFRG